MTSGCPICQKAVKPFAVASQDDLVICTNCRHITWNKTPTLAELDAYYTTEYAGSHNQRTLQEDAAAYYKTHVKELCDRLGKNENLTIVDYGCAWPVLLRTAMESKSFSRAIGVEWDMESVAYGRANGIDMMRPEEFLETIPDGSVDVMRFSHVLEHLIDPVDILQKAVRKLKSTGLVYITQPVFPHFFPDSPPSSLLDTVYPGHMHFFTAHSLVLMLQQAGLKPVELFAFQNEDTLKILYDRCVDTAHAEKHLQPYRDMKPAAYSPLNGYPWYIGDNVALYANNVEAKAAFSPKALVKRIKNRLYPAWRILKSCFK